ncbi:MAG: fructokinase [Bradyrhizobium sp.]|jgi:sugar/nucleoside kinase (ribokinase family)|nr:fructokinase [Bradyrhizobium sp.]
MLLSCGDALVDFLPVKSVDGRDAAVPVAGGSCLNIAVGMARLGAPAGFVGGVSTDLFGRMIADHALTSQVELRYATRSEHQTTLAFVRHVGGEPQYAFYDVATASGNWTHRHGSIPFAEIEAIHVGSTTLANDKGGRVPSLEAFGRRPRCKPYRLDRPSSETLHNNGRDLCWIKMHMARSGDIPGVTVTGLQNRLRILQLGEGD